MKHRLCVTDLDGTLLHSNHKISDVNRKCLQELGERGIIRVLATGRSLWSLKQVITTEALFDYLIVATGAGILSWPEEELLYSTNILQPDITRVYHALEALDVDYMMHHGVPDTHLMEYRARKGCSDFWHRIKYHQRFASPLNPEAIATMEAVTLFLAIADDPDMYQVLKEKLAPLTVISTTSATDQSSIWIEVLGQQVNKGSALSWLLKHLAIDPDHCMVIGNEMNDLHMLDAVPNAYVPHNAIPHLLSRFTHVAHHDDDGFSEAVQHWLTKV